MWTEPWATRAARPAGSQLLVIRSASAFRRHPRDHLIRVHDVARLAVIAVREIEERHLAAPVRGRLRLVDLRRTEMEARISKLFPAARDADLGVEDQQMRGLILLVQHAAVVDVRHLVERQHAVELHLRRRMRMLISEIALDRFHPLVTAMTFESVSDAVTAAAGHDAESRVYESRELAAVERLMKITLLPQLLARPRHFEHRLVLAELRRRIILIHQRRE